MKTRHMYVFIKGIVEKLNFYWHMHIFFDLYVIISYKNQSNFEQVQSPITIINFIF